MTKPRLSDAELIGVMRIDPLGELSDATGIHHSDGALGDLLVAASLPLFHAKSSTERAELSARGDTYFMMSLAEFEAAMDAEGFERVLCIPVEKGEKSGEDDLLMYAHRDGMLVHVITYGEDRRPSGSHPMLLVNWKGDAWGLPLYGSGGGKAKGEPTPWGFNIEKGFRLQVAALRAQGELVSPWVEPPFIWLCSYHEGTTLGDQERRDLTQARLRMLTDWVKDFIGVVLK